MCVKQVNYEKISKTSKTSKLRISELKISLIT